MFHANIVTLNIPGFGNGSKQQLIFDFAKSLRADFICLQETLLSQHNAINSLRAKWPGKSFWSPALGKQGGVAILVAKNLCLKVRTWSKDTSARVISLSVKVDNLRFNVFNIYAPTNPAERKVFLESLPIFFMPNSSRIVAGDFNCYECDLNKFGGNSSISADLTDFHVTHQLIGV